MRSSALLLVAVVSLSIAPPRAHAQAPLLRGFGGPMGFGSNILPANDDGSTAMQDLTPAFPGGLRFFGGPYTTFWVNNNGNITFRGSLGQYTPRAFPVASQPMIAPYWGDVDTRGSVPVAGENLVYWHLEPGRLIVTWHRVGYYGAHTNLRMDFQMILTNTFECGTGDFDVEFRYQECGWTTGDASGGTGGFGGTPAQAGFDAGNLIDYVAMPGSLTMAILDVCTTSNVAIPGVWRFAVRSGAVFCADAGQPCTIPDAQGACSAGRTQCIGSEVVCQPIGTSTPERCDSVDNDCDGEVDNGSGLCGALDVCSEGICVPPCFEGGCLEGQTCTSAGLCVDTRCVDVECTGGERCVAGVCIDACNGIVCPHGQQCISGRCTDLCSVLTCDSTQVCESGVCVGRCPCRPCGAGSTCGFDGVCIPSDCDLTICPPGFYCEGATCHDACEGVVCPSGQRCELGNCVDPPPPMPDAGPPEVDAGSGEDAGATEDAGTTPADAGVIGDDGGGPPVVPMNGGCGCRTAPEPSAPGWAFGLVITTVLSVARQRRSRR